MYRFAPMAFCDGTDSRDCSGPASKSCLCGPSEGRSCTLEKNSSGNAESEAGRNTTRDYHRLVPIDLMKEFTICESFSKPDSPYAIALERPSSYGSMVGGFLAQSGLLKEHAIICEVGGGYGTLMHGLLTGFEASIDRVYMIDLSRSLLHRQRSLLSPWRTRITSIQADIHELMDALSGIDLFIINEIMGDLDTLTGVDPRNIPEEADEFIRAYELDIPDRPFNFNIGAIKLVEAVCRSGAPAFLTEHSCDPIIPAGKAFLARGLELDSYPREIKLYRHSEYTIRFSHLERIARAHGKEARSGSLLDIIGLKASRSLETIFSMRACDTEDHEIIYELLDHIREYRWLTIS